MKIKRIPTPVPLIIGIGMFSGSAGMAGASETPAAPNLVAQTVELHAPNNATQTVTGWVPRTSHKIAHKTATVRNGVAKVIELRAPNSSIQPVMAWISDTKNKFEAAPLK